MKNELQRNKIQMNSYVIRTEIYEGKEHIVVPVVMMVEGVHAGSDGPILHTAEELGHITASWNGEPVVIQHPQNEEGAYISANSPGVKNVGRIFNTHFEDGKLKAEAWLVKSKLQSQSPEALASINNQQPLDVSVGVFTDTEYSAGTFGEENYVGIARNYRPDHLALLPGGTGACSWADGCGIRVNESKQNKTAMEKEITIVTNSLQNRQGEFTALVEKVRSKINAMDSEMSWHYVMEIYDDGLIYMSRNRESGKETYYQQPFEVDSETGDISFNEEPKKVVKKTEYITTNEENSKVMNNKKQKGEKQMSKAKCALVSALITNAATQFNEEHREMLMGLELEVLELIEPAPQRTTPTPLTDETVASYLATKSKEDVVKFMPQEIQANIQKMEEERAAKRKEMIDGILAVNKSFTEPELNAMSCDMLSKLSAMAKGEKEEIPADYSAQAGAMQANKGTDEEEPLMN